jgi:hypothetical protein
MPFPPFMFFESITDGYSIRIHSVHSGGWGKEVLPKHIFLKHKDAICLFCRQ